VQRDLQWHANTILERLHLAVSAAVEMDWARSTGSAQGDTASGAHACDASTRIHPASLTIPQFVQLMQQLPVDQYLRLRHAATCYVEFGQSIG